MKLPLNPFPMRASAYNPNNLMDPLKVVGINLLGKSLTATKPSL
jgi:hypothetical protein